MSTMATSLKPIDPTTVKEAFLIEASSTANGSKAESAIYQANPEGVFWRRYPSHDSSKVTIVGFSSADDRESFDQWSNREVVANRVVAERSAGARLSVEEYKRVSATTKFATLIS